MSEVGCCKPDSLKKCHYHVIAGHVQSEQPPAISWLARSRDIDDAGLVAAVDFAAEAESHSSRILSVMWIRLACDAGEMSAVRVEVKRIDAANRRNLVGMKNLKSQI